MQDTLRFSGERRLGDLGVFTLKTEVRETNSPAQIIWKIVQCLRAITV